jgi:hypothetical protein
LGKERPINELFGKIEPATPASRYCEDLTIFRFHLSQPASRAPSEKAKPINVATVWFRESEAVQFTGRLHQLAGPKSVRHSRIVPRQPKQPSHSQLLQLAESIT